MGEPDEAVIRYEASLDDAPHRWMTRRAWRTRSTTWGWFPSARPTPPPLGPGTRRASSIRRELGDPWGIALSLSNLGDVANADHDFDTAESLHQEALDIRRQLGEPRAIGYSLNNLGESALGKGDLSRAGELFRAAQEHLHRVGDRSGEALVLHNLGLTALRQRNLTKGVVALASAYQVASRDPGTPGHRRHDDAPVPTGRERRRVRPRGQVPDSGSIERRAARASVRPARTN